MGKGDGAELFIAEAWPALKATTPAALQQGQVNGRQEPSLDLLGVARRNAGLTIDTLDPSGLPGMLRFGHLQPPFNNPAIRRALLGAVNQADYMQTVAESDHLLVATASYKGERAVVLVATNLLKQAGINVVSTDSQYVGTVAIGEQAVAG